LTKRAKRDSFAQNVRGVINFDGYWIYALAGWEGSAHNGQVFNDAMLRGFPLFEGKYYLGGAGYDLHQYVGTCDTISRNGRKQANVLKMQMNFSM
jgi:hypothetical protein